MKGCKGFTGIACSRLAFHAVHRRGGFNIQLVWQVPYQLHILSDQSHFCLNNIKWFKRTLVELIDVMSIIGVGTTEKLEGPAIGGVTIHDNEGCFEMPPRRDKILLSGGGVISAF